METSDEINSTTASPEVATTPAPKPKPQKRKRKGNLSRHPRGQQKNSTTHHLQPVITPPPPTATATNNKPDPRVWNLQRAIKRRDDKIESATKDRDKYAAANKQLKRTTKAMGDTLQSTRIESRKKLKEMEKEHAEAIEAVQEELEIVQTTAEKEIQKERERAGRKMKRAGEVLDAANNRRIEANAKAADAAKAMDEATVAKKAATKEKVAATRERKDINAKAGAKANAAAKKVSTKEDEILKLKQQLSAAKREMKAAQENSLRQAALLEEYEKSMEEMEEKMKMKEKDAKWKKASAAERTVIEKEHIEGTGFKRWSLKIVQLILEFLVAGGAPSSFNAILVSFFKFMQPDATINELPSIWFIRRCRTVLLIVCQLMSAYRLAKAEKWGQLNCDETKRHQTAYLNLVLSCVEESCEGLPPEYKPILMSACILPKDESSEAQKDAIVAFIDEKNEWLDEWATLCEKMFPDFTHDINRGGLSLSKLAEGGLVTQDTCNAANKGSTLIIGEIKKAAAGKVDEENILVIQGHCHHHLRNIWWKWLETCLSKYLTDALEGSLEKMDPRLRVTTKMSEIIRAVDKEFSLPANYPKGHGKAFKHWLDKYHPGALLVPTLRSTGARHDLNVEGAGAIYYNRSLYIQFLDEQLRTPNKDNILQENLFIILSSSEMIALCRICSIFHFAFSLPLRWLAGNTQNLAEYNWSVLSMSRALNTFEKALQTIENDGNLLLNEDYVMNTFKDIAEELPPFKEYLKYIFELKGTTQKVLGGKELRKELFNPERDENKDTDDLVAKMAVAAATAVLKELHDTDKHTHEYLDSMDGPLSWKNITDAMHKATLGKLATNDVAESPFAGLTQQLQAYTSLSGTNAAAVAQARFNGDFHRVETELCRRKKADADDEHPSKNGTFVDLPQHMLQSAIQLAMNKSKEVKKKEQASLKRQEEVKQEKMEVLRKNQIESASVEYIDRLYYFDMNGTMRHWKSVDEVDAGLAKLSSKTAKLEEVKEQIRIRTIGLGWADLHHPWSKNNVNYSVEQLVDHLKNKIIPEERKRTIPDAPPVDLPERKKLPVLGTLAADVVKMDEAYREKGKEVRDNAVKKRDELEQEGTGDRYMEMQPRKPPPLDASMVGRRIEFCYRYEDEEGEANGGGFSFHWLSGKVDAVFSAKSKKNFANIRWDDAL